MAVLVVWLALSVGVTLAFVFGASVGYRRGFEEAQAQYAQRPGRRVAASPNAVREVRLPDDARSGGATKSGT